MITDLGKLHEHVPPRNSVVIKDQEAVVVCVDSEFRSDVAHFHAGEGHMGSCVSERNEEEMGTLQTPLFFFSYIYLICTINIVTPRA